MRNNQYWVNLKWPVGVAEVALAVTYAHVAWYCAPNWGFPSHTSFWIFWKYETINTIPFAIFCILISTVVVVMLNLKLTSVYNDCGAGIVIGSTCCYDICWYVCTIFSIIKMTIPALKRMDYNRKGNKLYWIIVQYFLIK